MKKGLLCLWLFSFFVQSFGQAPNIQNPEAANLIKYLDVPVDKSTGVPNIDIPLYNVQLNGFNLPLSLSYHAGGIKVEEESTNAGLGWVLNAGGIITREIKNKPDEIGGYYTFSGPPAVPANRWVDPPYYAYVNGVLTHVKGVIHDLVPGIYDTEPDLFYFNVNGLSGKFLFDKNHVVKLIPEQNIKIELIGAPFTGFKLTNSDGTQYIFTVKESSGSTDNLGQSAGINTSGWRLSQIITINKETIDFNYQAQGYSFQKVRPKAVLLSRNLNCPENAVPTVSYNHTNSQHIQSIVFANGRVDFTYKNSFREDYNSNFSSYGSVNLTRALESIQVSNTQTNEVIKKYLLSTSYFVSTSGQPYNTEEYQKKRLRLDQIQECGSNNDCLPPYIFYYNKHNTTINNFLPSRYSTGQDHWGYCNGADYNSSLYTSLNCSGSANRDINHEYSAAYILDEIKSPTGGVKSFNYENHDFAGGLRIKEIKDDPGGGLPLIERHYTYDSPLLTGGAPNYSQSVDVSEMMSITQGAPQNYEICDQFYTAGYNYSWHHVFQVPVTYTGEITSNHVIYGQVTEHTTGNGSIVSEFDISHFNDEVDIYESSVYPFVVESPLLITGKLIRETIKDQAGNELKETTYNYGSTRTTIIPNTDVYQVYRAGCIQLVKYCTLYSGSVFLSNKNEITYSSNGQQLETSTTYDYASIPNHFFVTKESTTLNNGKIGVKRYKYPLDYKAEIGTVTGSDTWDQESRAIKELIDRNIVSRPIEILTLKEQNNTESILKGELLKFKLWTNSQSVPLTSVNSISILNLNAPIPYSNNFFSKIVKSGNAYSFGHNNNYSVEQLFDKYDDKNNLVGSVGIDGIRNTFVWGYNKQYPVAKVIGSNHATVNSFINQSVLDNLSSTESQVRNQLNNIRTGLNNTSALVTTYTYSPLIGISSGTDQNNKTRFYEYDNFKRLTVVRDNDNNVLKKICYNYAGQQENCTTPCPPNSQPNWQNTATALRCQQGSCGNTGYQEQEQRDINPCSSTYNQTQWVSAGYNPTACPVPSCVSLTSTNVGGNTNFIATYDDGVHAPYTFAVSTASGLQSLGTIPTGTYTLTITRTPGNASLYATYKSGCFKQTIIGVGPAVFYNVAVSASTCNSIYIDNTFD